MREVTKHRPYETNATRAHVTGWACKHCNRFYGDDERSQHQARWCCATDLPCNTSECVGRLSKPYLHCDKCRERRATAKWEARERRAWDGKQMLYSEIIDKYASTPHEMHELCIDYREDEGSQLSEMRVVLCEPVSAPCFDIHDYLNDVLPEDGNAPGEWEAVEKAYEEYVKANKPFSWMPGKYAWDGS